MVKKKCMIVLDPVSIISRFTHLQRPWFCPGSDFVLPLSSDLVGADNQRRSTALCKKKRKHSVKHISTGQQVAGGGWPGARRRGEVLICCLTKLIDH